ncbi:MAG: small multi-drug export protein [Christensenellaceae bacterium]|jgi:uncharacterized membrane protein|nr:small multi-drug export protein [Christensenellaceae bacterium]
MNDWLIEVALKITFGVKTLAVMLFSMIPMFELKGGILIALKPKIGFNYGQAFLWGWLGSTVICIPLYFLLTLLFKWKPFARVETLARNKAKKLFSKSGQASPKKDFTNKFLGVLAFVAIPVPFTGVWTGTVIAKLLGLKWYWTALACAIGNAIAGGLIVLLAYLMGPKNLDLLLWILFTLVALALAYTLYRLARTNEVQETK